MPHFPDVPDAAAPLAEKSLNLGQVRMFCRAVALGSLGEAAREMGVTQSAISKGLVRFQEEEGVRLLKNRHGRMILTAVGESFLPIARRLLEQERLASECLRGFRQGDTIAILTSESFGIYYLPPVIRRLRERWPQTRVRVDLAHNASIEARIAHGSHDVGIVSRPGQDPDLAYFHLFDEELALVCPPGHELSGCSAEPQQLSGEAFVLHEAGSVPRLLAEEFFARHALETEIPLEVSNVETMKAMVREGAGLAFLSRQSAFSELASGKLGEIKLRGDHLRRGFYFVHRRDREAAVPMRRLYHALHERDNPVPDP